MNEFTLIFLACLLAVSLITEWLALRQRAAVTRHRHHVPETFASRITLAAHQRAADYSLAKLRLEQIEIIVGALLTLGWTLGGGLDALASLWNNAALGPVLRGTLLIVSAMLIMTVLDIPFDIYRTFVVEARFGFNRTMPGLYIADTVKQGLLSIALGAPLIAALLWLIEHAGAAWWLYGWTIWMLFICAMLWLYPVLIAPLFNRFTPLQDETLRERIVRLLTRCGFSSNGIFIMDGSRRSGHGNAYFTGLGANKRIVFFDTLLKNLNADEIEAVLAHELGHFKHGHVKKRLLLMTITSLVGFAVLGLLSKAEWFYHGLGVEHPSYAQALILFVMIVPYFTAFFSPLSSYWQRRHEFEADDYAAAYSDAGNLIRALVKLYEENAATLTPDLLYSAYHDSHPPAPVRISHLSNRLVRHDTITESG